MEANNMAASREALSEIVLLTVKAGVSISCDVACGIIASKAKHALKQPPRNCDMFGGDTKKLHDEWWKWSGDLRNCNDDGTVKLTYGEWLLAKAKGEKGGSK